MMVSDVMTRGAISVAPDATIEDAVRTMLSRDVSGLLVVDGNGDLVGIVTGGDLLRRDELGTQRSLPWWRRLLVSPAQQAAEFSQAHGRYVRDVMTETVVTVAEDAPLEDVVTAMERHRIKRVPVTRDDRVAGVVSRSDLLRALINRARPAEAPAADDDAIRSAILQALRAQPWAPATTLAVTVSGGAVDLNGTVGNEQERRGIRVIAENVPGVRAVHDRMVFVEPYTGTVVEAPDDAPGRR